VHTETIHKVSLRVRFAHYIWLGIQVRLSIFNFHLFKVGLFRVLDLHGSPLRVSYPAKVRFFSHRLANSKACLGLP
jgi:hypothetical protein